MTGCSARLVAVASAACLALLTTPSYAQQGTQEQVAPPVIAPVAVLVFSNITGETADDWMGAGIAETVATGLESVGGLAVIRAGTSGTGAGPASGAGSPIDIGRALSARWIVSGAYQRLGDRIRITTRITDIETTVVVQSTIVDGTVDELFSLQDRLVTQIREGLESGRDGGAPIRASRVPTTAKPSIPAEAGAALPPGRTPAIVIDGPPPPAAVPRGDGLRATIGRTPQPPRIDGRLDDAVWQTATHITEFTQMAPVEGAPGTERTEVWMAYDSDNMYFAFYAHYSDPGMMRINRADRDDIRGDDQMAVLFDPFLDQQRAYQFEVNGYGVQADSLVNADGTTGRSSSMMSSQSSSSRSSQRSRGIRGDDSWNALFATSGQIVEDGWTAEMAIPFKSLRYPARAGGELHRWGFQITRRIRGKSEAQSWSPVSRAVVGQLTQFGILEGLENLSQSRNLEILPELTGLRFGTLDGDTGRFDQRDPVGDIGVGIKYGITPNLTVDLTYNPDFSQIESDRPQIETNQRFALLYPEQRPFFLEGQEIFQMSTPLNLLHTRTIVEPRFGGKLTGKVGNTTLGVIVADDEAAGRLDDRTDPRFGGTAQTVVGRARYDFYSESYLGAIMTAREFGHEHNRVAGVDGRFRLSQTHRVSFMAVGSSTQHETEGALGGPALEADFTHQGRHLGYGASYSSIDPEFRTDSGFLPRVDLRQATADLSYRWWPESTLMTWGPSLTYVRLYDHAGVLQDEQIQGLISFQFRNNCMVRSIFSRDLERYQGIDFRKTGYGSFGGCSGRILSIFGGFNVGDGILFSDSPFLGRSTAYNVIVSAKPTTRLSTRIRAISSRFVNPVGNAELFDVKIFRTETTYQFTERFLLRHIMEHNTLSMTLGNNLLLTYRINAGTVAFLGYDDRFQRGTRINDTLFLTTALQRTNRAVFGKLSYLFRH